MFFNICEHLLVDTNLLFLASSYIFAYKGYIFISLSYFILTIVSATYHICYLPVYVFNNRTYLYYELCPINNMVVYGMLVMFIDVFFANMVFVFSALLTTPIYKARGTSFKYFLSGLCMLIILIVAFYVGFFPDPQNPDKPVGEIASLISRESLQIMKKRHILQKYQDFLMVISKMNKTTYISIIAFSYFLVVYFVLLVIYVVELLKDHEIEIKRMNLKEKIDFVFYKLAKYYLDNFFVVFLILSSISAVIAIIIWVIIEGLFPAYYMYTHGIWHLLSGIASIFIGFSIKKYSDFSS